MYENELALDFKNFAQEWFQFRSLIFSHQILKKVSKQLQLIKDMQVPHTFKNMETCLKIVLTMSVTNCSGERPFSSLKRIKNTLR